MDDVIVIGTENITSEGLTLVLNKPARLKGRKGLKSKEWWLSWDAIGEAMIDGYTNKVSVEDRDKLRKAE